MNQTNTKPKRLYIYTKDVCRITGKGRAAAQSLMKEVKQQLGKKPEAELTVMEFCQVQGLKIDEVNLFL